MATPAPPPSPARMRQIRGQPLGCFFAPAHVAVIGATERAGSVGRAVLENLATFGGTVTPVNPRRRQVLGRAAVPTIAELAGTVDLAILATPAATVPGLVRECAAAGVKGAIVLAAGFKEAGAAGATLEQELLAARGTLRVLGPNCLGVMSPPTGLNATFAGAMARPGSVAFLSQSGALCSAILDWSLREQVGFSGFVSVGGLCDVGWADLIDHFGDDPRTESVVIYLESIGDARAFLSAAREVAFTKPMVVLKPGRTEAARRAAARHTGAVPGDDAVLDAAFRRAGILRVETIEEVFDMAEVLAKQPRPRGPRLAIVTNAGGPAALAADSLVAAGGELAVLAPETTARLGASLPPRWSQSDPIDLLGDAHAGHYAAAIAAAAHDPACDGVLAILTPQAMTDATAIAEQLRKLGPLEGGKPLLASWMGGAAVEAGEAILNAAGIPTYRYPDRAARAFASMWRYSVNVAALYETPGATDPPADAGRRREGVARVIQAARAAGRTVLSDVEMQQVLSAYGLTTLEPRPARTEKEAQARATALGFPVALRLHPRSTTAAPPGGVFLPDLRTPAEVKRAWLALRRPAHSAAAGTAGGVVLQRHVEPGGCELFLGSTVDPQIGPVLRFGAGGARGGVFQDYVLGLPPLNRALARQLIQRTRIQAALPGGATPPSPERAAVEQALVAFSQLVAEQPGLAAITLDPVVVAAGRVVVAAARLELPRPGTKAADQPRPAIRPYPANYVTPTRLRDGTTLEIRPIRPDDEPLMVEFHHGLSDRSVYHRYFSFLPLEQRIAHRRLARLCFVDFDREIAVVADWVAPGSGRHAIVGVGRLCRAHGRPEAEFAIVVSDAWQRRGLGTLLLRALVRIGRAEGLARITGSILAENSEMQGLCRRLGFTVQHRGGGECHSVLTL